MLSSWQPQDSLGLDWAVFNYPSTSPVPQCLLSSDTFCHGFYNKVWFALSTFTAFNKDLNLQSLMLPTLKSLSRVLPSEGGASRPHGIILYKDLSGLSRAESPTLLTAKDLPDVNPLFQVGK